jgi:hypothetical protein
VSQRGLNTDPQEADIEMDQEVFRESNRAVAEFAGLNPYPTHNFLAISSIYSRSDPRLHFIPPTVAIEDCLARSRSSRPAGCTTCRLPRASPQAPVLPRSLPLVSPCGLHHLQAVPSLPRLRCCLARSRSSRPAGCTTCRLPRASPDSGAPTPASISSRRRSGI